MPAELGEPDAVDVSADRVFVSMSWDTAEGPVRLDQFDGRLDYRIAKTAPGVQYASVAGADALWFEEPHEVTILDEQDRPRTESARLAGHTLIWPLDDVTLRLEGDLTLERAVEIGASATPYSPLTREPDVARRCSRDTHTEEAPCAASISSEQPSPPHS